LDAFRHVSGETFGTVLPITQRSAARGIPDPSSYLPVYWIGWLDSRDPFEPLRSGNDAAVDRN
jgi:hypothetical protein